MSMEIIYTCKGCRKKETVIQQTDSCNLTEELIKAGWLANYYAGGTFSVYCPKCRKAFEKETTIENGSKKSFNRKLFKKLREIFSNRKEKQQVVF